MRDFSALPLGRARRLHFGCGPHLLDVPWENFDREVDIGKPLIDFPSACAEYIFAEHVIEHVPFLAGMGFLSECFRVLSPGGVLRLSFPDVTRFENELQVRLYLQFLQSLSVPARDVGDIARFLLLGSGHAAMWTANGASAALTAVGFRAFQIYFREYGRSPLVALDGIDGHHLTSSLTAAAIETTVIEATK